MRERCALAAVLMLLLTAGPVWPQTSHVSPSSSLDVLMPDVVRVSAASRGQSARITVDGPLRGLLDELLRRSPAFRRQWDYLMQVRGLSVRLALVHSSPVEDAHAASVISSLADGSVLAVVSIPGGVRVAESLGHEVEHIIERVDGISVAARHALGDGSVRRSASGSFETARATLAGRMVAAEYHAR